jgi:transposase
MDVVHTHCADLDVHKKTAVDAVSEPAAGGGWHTETRTFGTMTADLLTLSDWLTSHGVTHVAMESTGEYWKPVFNILEGNFDNLCTVDVADKRVRYVYLVSWGPP